MKIIVRTKTKARENKVERVNQPTLDLESKKVELTTYKVSVKEAPVAGKANQAIIRALADYFNTSISQITLISGQTSKQKIFRIE